MFPVRLKELRKAMHLTQTELANIMHLSHGAIAMWETNKRQPDNATLSKLADFFGVSVDYLLGRDDARIIPQENDIMISEEGKALAEIISLMTEEEIDALTSYADFIMSKRK